MVIEIEAIVYVLRCTVKSALLIFPVETPIELIWFCKEVVEVITLFISVLRSVRRVPVDKPIATPSTDFCISPEPEGVFQVPSPLKYVLPGDEFGLVVNIEPVVTTTPLAKVPEFTCDGFTVSVLNWPCKDVVELMTFCHIA